MPGRFLNRPVVLVSRGGSSGDGLRLVSVEFSGCRLEAIEHATRVSDDALLKRIKEYAQNAPDPNAGPLALRE